MDNNNKFDKIEELIDIKEKELTDIKSIISKKYSLVCLEKDLERLKTDDIVFTGITCVCKDMHKPFNDISLEASKKIKEILIRETARKITLLKEEIDFLEKKYLEENNESKYRQ